jgi:hypothetical protein
MDKWSIATRVFAGAWLVLALILVFKIGLAMTGNYAVDWSGEARFWIPLVITGAGFLAARSSHSAV